MGSDSELIQKRQEVKAEILGLKEQIPSAQLFNQLGKTFKHNSAAYWLSNIVLLNIILIGPSILIGLLFGDIDKIVLFRIEGVMATELMIAGMIAGYFAIHAIFDDLANRIIDNITNADDLLKLLNWLKQTWSMQNVLAFALPFALLWALLSVGSTSFYIHYFVGFGFSLWVSLVGLLAGLLFYVPFWSSLVSFNLRKYRYEMNSFSPADSEIVSDISIMLTSNIYALSASTAVITLFATSKLVNQQLRDTFSIPLLIIAWAIIIAQFIITRSTLGAITNREKWKTLNRIQTKINALEATGDLSEKDTAERLFRLADIHKQIMASKTNTLDLKSFSTLFSQLMLPLLGLLLGNLDKVLKLFSK